MVTLSANLKTARNLRYMRTSQYEEGLVAREISSTGLPVASYRLLTVNCTQSLRLMMPSSVLIHDADLGTNEDACARGGEGKPGRVFEFELK